MTKRLALVTGAGGDIGRAICAALIAEGCAVIACDIDADAAHATAVATGAQAITADVTDPASVAAMAAQLYGAPLSVLVNNAGGVTAASLQSATAEDVQADLSLNTAAAFHCFKALEDDLKATQGNVVNIASINAFSACGHPGYSAAKAALVHLTKMIAVEYGQFGIRANAIAPGSVRTSAWDQRAIDNPAVFDEIARWYPLRRIALPTEVAATVAFLASPAASAISGACIPVDCGYMAGQPDLARSFSQSSDY